MSDALQVPRAVAPSRLGPGATARGGESLAPGFQKGEAWDLLALNAEMNGLGGPGAVCPEPSGWLLVADGCDPNNLAKRQGFGPFDNRWKLWKEKGGDTFAVVIRGTIVNADSIAEDMLANTLPAAKVMVPAGPGRMIAFQLATAPLKPRVASGVWPEAEVHAGFSYGLAAVLFDGAHGLLKALQKELAPGSRLLVTGWSQGGAIATLLHSFLHHAGAEGGPEHPGEGSGQDPFGLWNEHWSIKTYVFAQPKPGNWRYAMDLAETVSNKGKLFVINNYDDPICQVPMAMQVLSDSLVEQDADALGKHRLLGLVMKLATRIRRRLSRTLDEAELDRVFLKPDGAGGRAYAEQLDPAFHTPMGKAKAQGGSSLNYSQAGTLIAVRPHAEDNPVEHEAERAHDFLWEHHLSRYQQLAKYWP